MANQSQLAYAQPSQKQNKLQHECALQDAEALQQDIHDTLDKIHATVERLSTQHNKSEALILEQLHLGGNVLKQKHAPGINNAYAHCEAWYEDECELKF